MVAFGFGFATQLEMVGLVAPIVSLDLGDEENGIHRLWRTQSCPLWQWFLVKQQGMVTKHPLEGLAKGAS